MMSTGTHRLLVHVCVCLPPHLPTFVWEAQDPHGRGVDPPHPYLPFEPLHSLAERTGS